MQPSGPGDGAGVDRRTVQIGVAVVAVLLVVFVVVPLVRAALQPDWVGTSMHETFSTSACNNIDIVEHDLHWRGMRPASVGRAVLDGELHFDSEHTATFRTADGLVVKFHENRYWGDLACAIDGATN